MEIVISIKLIVFPKQWLNIICKIKTGSDVLWLGCSCPWDQDNGPASVWCFMEILTFFRFPHPTPAQCWDHCPHLWPVKLSSKQVRSVAPGGPADGWMRPYLPSPARPVSFCPEPPRRFPVGSPTPCPASDSNKLRAEGPSLAGEEISCRGHWCGTLQTLSSLVSRNCHPGGFSCAMTEEVAVLPDARMEFLRAGSSWRTKHSYPGPGFGPPHLPCPIWAQEPGRGGSYTSWCPNWHPLGIPPLAE